MADASTVVEATGLGVDRGGRAVINGADLTVGLGLTAIVGPNGSGKSTLLAALATLLPAARGRLQLVGLDPTRRTDLRRIRSDLGYLPQAWDLPAGTRVVDALRHGAWLHRCPDPRAAVDRAVAELDLTSVRGERLSSLSGGTHRRVAIAQALVHRPRLLLLDEPTAGLDLGQRTALWDLLAHHARGAGVVVISHDVDEVVERTDQVIVVAHRAARMLPSMDRAAVAAAVS